jgi:hypothetical protein
MNKAKAIGWIFVYMAVFFGIMLFMSVALAAASVTAGVSLGINSSSAFENFIETTITYVGQGAPLLVLNFAQEIVMFACFGLWYYIREKKYHYLPNYKRAFTLRNIITVMGIAFFGQYASNLIVLFIYAVLPEQFANYQDVIQTFDIDAGNPFLTVFCVVLFGPLVEELLFRGMIFGKMRRVFSFWPSALVSAILFGVFHLNLVQGVYAAVFGVVLAFVFEKTETIWGCYMLHALFNLCSYIIAGYETALSNFGIYPPVYAEVILGVISLGIVIVLIRRFGTSKRQTNDSLT